MSEKLNTAIAVIGIDIGKNSFHVVGYDQRGAIVLHQKWSRGHVIARTADSPSGLSSGLSSLAATSFWQSRTSALARSGLDQLFSRLIAMAS